MNEDTNNILAEILKWQKLQGINLLRTLLPELLNNDKKINVYEMTDGKNTIREIRTKTGISFGAISKWWNEWYSYGVLEKNNEKYKKLISLQELGLNKKTNED